MTERKRPVELLSPAKNCEIGIEAIRHGADAVYIGPPRFGARVAAGNKIEEIERLVKYAHLFGARVYVTLNTILRDDELEEVRRMVYELYRIGVDALIVQDMALLQMDLPPIALHASTQTDNRTLEKVRFLERVGFSQVVLARELSLDQIRLIRQHTDVALEAFVHGALCVSYSGQCYISCSQTGRSANRGECAQYCRLPYTLKDGQGNTVVTGRHLLSLKDLNRSDRLEELLDAGISSFKIEGRLKDMSYVKNCTAYYRQRLDELFVRRPEYCRSSFGAIRLNFVPVLEKSFNRGFTHYFLDGKPDRSQISPDTPKSIGEFVGTVKEVFGQSFTVTGVVPLHNGDGLCFLDRQGRFDGVRVNRAEGNRIFPATCPALLPQMKLYRNYDHEFEKKLANVSAERKLSVRLQLSETAEGYCLRISDETGAVAVADIAAVKESAKTEQQENIIRQLSKLGDTPFRSESVRVDLAENRFIPSSFLATLRRQAVTALLKEKTSRYRREYRKRVESIPNWPDAQMTYLGNVSNRLARQFYRDHGVQQIDPAYELSERSDVPLMFTRYCIRRELGCCLRDPKGKKLAEPLTLQYRNQVFRLSFDCRICEMRIYRDKI